MDDKLKNDYYKRYVNSYAKRFYTPYEKQYIFKIINYFIDDGQPFFVVKNPDENDDFNWAWDVEDCIIITCEQPIVEDERVANVHHHDYKGYNPF